MYYGKNVDYFCAQESVKSKKVMEKSWITPERSSQTCSGLNIVIIVKQNYHCITEIVLNIYVKN